MPNTNEIINLIHEKKDLIDFDYNDIKDLILIQNTLFQDIITLTQDKEEIKKALRSALKLDKKELILIKKEKIVIKILVNIKRNIIDEKNPSIANRYNGYSMDEIENLYNDYFDEEYLEEFIADLSYQVFNYLFVRKRVNNNFYEKNIYPTIQKIIVDSLDDINDDITLKKGFAGYILRVNFLEVFTYISEDILESIAYRDEYLMNWIKYYHGQVVVDGNQRYEAPYMINAEGQKYNPSAIFGPISMWYKTHEKATALRKRLEETNKKLSVLTIDDLSPKEYKKEVIMERQEFEKNISEINEHLEELMNERHDVKDNNIKLEINSEIKDLRHSLREYKTELEEINIELSSIDTNTSRSLEENIIRLDKALKHEETIIKQNTKLYFSIKSALIKALTSKKIPIDK